MDDIAIHVSFERRDDIPFQEYVRTVYYRDWLFRRKSRYVYRNLSKPALVVTSVFSETARHWIGKYDLYTQEILPPVLETVVRPPKYAQEKIAKYSRQTLGMFLFNNPRTIHRDSIPQLNHAQDTIVAKFKEVKAIIESHNIATPSSYDI